MKKAKKTDSVFLITVIFMIILTALGRAVSYFNTIVSMDIAYDAWISPALSYLTEILVCVRMTISLVGVTYAVYYRGRRDAVRFISAGAIVAFADYSARFIIDLASSAIVGAEMLAASWLLMQFLYDMVFIVLSYIIAGAVMKKQKAAPTARQSAKYTAERSCAYSIIAVMVSRIALEVWYLVDFMLMYTDITGTETASIVGSFLKVIVIYGGIALIIGEGYIDFMKKRTQNAVCVKST